MTPDELFKIKKEIKKAKRRNKKEEEAKMGRLNEKSTDSGILGADTEVQAQDIVVPHN